MLSGAQPATAASLGFRLRQHLFTGFIQNILYSKSDSSVSVCGNTAQVKQNLTPLLI